MRGTGIAGGRPVPPKGKPCVTSSCWSAGISAKPQVFNAPAFFKRATPLVRWTEGFEPCRNEMLFEHNSSCCCYSTPFTALVSESRSGILLAGFAGEQTCLSILIDAFHRNHK